MPHGTKEQELVALEFGTSPMLVSDSLTARGKWAVCLTRPCFVSHPGKCASLQTQYDLFLPSGVPPSMVPEIKDVRKTEHTLVVQGDHDERMTLQRGKRRHR